MSNPPEGNEIEVRVQTKGGEEENGRIEGFCGCTSTEFLKGRPRKKRDHGCLFAMDLTSAAIFHLELPAKKGEGGAGCHFITEWERQSSFLLSSLQRMIQDWR